MCVFNSEENKQQCLILHLTNIILLNVALLAHFVNWFTAKVTHRLSMIFYVFLLFLKPDCFCNILPCSYYPNYKFSLVWWAADSNVGDDCYVEVVREWTTGSCIRVLYMSSLVPVELTLDGLVCWHTTTNACSGLVCFFLSTVYIEQEGRLWPTKKFSARWVYWVCIDTD